MAWNVLRREDGIPENEIHIRNEFYLVGIVVLYYDHIITFDREVAHMWYRNGRIPWLFFINRYFAPIAYIAVNISPFMPSRTVAECKKSSSAIAIVTLISHVIVGVVLVLRTFALYGRSFKILGFILIVSMPLIGTAVWSLFSQRIDDENVVLGCNTAAAKGSGQNHPRKKIRAYHRIWTFWEYHFQRRTMACVNIANAATFYVPSPSIEGCLSSLSTSVSVSLTSRLLINLQKKTLGRSTELISLTEFATSVHFRNDYSDLSTETEM
ncbi:hypothetical protein C8Q75DRAFT_613928 [Abortiporus biennis]|nr:hypothetical protein C8Q75DRAFT_613928 [Abortiporus biennis]